MECVEIVPQLERNVSELPLFRFVLTHCHSQLIEKSRTVNDMKQTRVISAPRKEKCAFF